jgi:glycosyltransferase involved in cell wall biosynthesis
MHAVLPADVDDPRRPSGGNLYDLRILAALDVVVASGSEGLGGPAEPGVVEIRAAGAWPHPSPSDLAALADALAAIPTGETVLLDGLVACAAPTVLVPEAGRLRLVVLVHLPLGDEAGADPVLVERERAVLRAASTVVATSDWSARRIAELHSLPGVDVVRPGVSAPPERYGSSETALALLCVGSLTPTKGQDVLLAALARLRDRPWTCRLVGPLDRAPDFVATLPRSPRVTLTGPLTGADLEAEFAAADLLVLPSRAESYGMVLVEALARGVPVIASEVGGVREAVGSAGALVPPEDPDALAAAIAAHLDDPRPLREAARRAPLRTWPEAARELHAILAGVTA